MSGSSSPEIVPTTGPRGWLRANREWLQRHFASTWQCSSTMSAWARKLVTVRSSRRSVPSGWVRGNPKEKPLGARTSFFVERLFREGTEPPAPLDLGVQWALRLPFEIDV